MNNGKLITCLRSLNDVEHARFADFMASPYFHHSAKLMQFYIWLMNYAPDFQHEDLQKEKAWALLYPTKPYNPQRLRENMSQLFSLLKRFWVLEEKEEKSWEE